LDVNPSFGQLTTKMKFLIPSNTNSKRPNRQNEKQLRFNLPTADQKTTLPAAKLVKRPKLEEDAIENDQEASPLTSDRKALLERLGRAGNNAMRSNATVSVIKLGHVERFGRFAWAKEWQPQSGLLVQGSIIFRDALGSAKECTVKPGDVVEIRSLIPWMHKDQPVSLCCNFTCTET
jgi:hypothetical protein